MNRYRITVTGEEPREVENGFAAAAIMDLAHDHIPFAMPSAQGEVMLARRQAAACFPDGGTVGPLPDGSTITVERIGGES